MQVGGHNLHEIQILFSGEKRKNIPICSLEKILPWALSFKGSKLLKPYICGILILYDGKNKKNISVSRLLKILPWALEAFQLPYIYRILILYDQSLNLIHYRSQSSFRTYRIWSNYRTVKQFHSLHVLFVYLFIKAYVVSTHLNCINLLMQFKWVPTTCFPKENQKKKKKISHKHYQYDIR